MKTYPCVAFFCHLSAGGHRSQLLHIKNIRPVRSDEQGLVGKYRPDGQGESEDPWDPVQHTQTSSGESTNDIKGDLRVFKSTYSLAHCLMYVQSLTPQEEFL